MADPFLPEPYIEVAWGFGPYNMPGASDWEDITDYVDEVHTSRGRDSELDTFPPGEMKVVLDNRDRLFDPLNTSSPYTGSLVENVPIRFRADISGTKYDLFYGFVDGWPASYGEGGFLKTLEINCSDLLKHLGERQAPDTMLEDILALDGLFDVSSNGLIRRWYRFDRVRDGEQVIADVMGNGSTDLQVRAKWDSQEKIAAASSLPALGIGQFKSPDTPENRFMGAEVLIGPFDNSPIKTDQWAIGLVLRIPDPKMDAFDLPLIWVTSHIPGAYEYTDLMSIGIHQNSQHSGSSPICPGCVYVDTDTAGVSLFFQTGPGGVNDLTGSNPLGIGTFNPFDGRAHSLVLWRHSNTLELWADGVKVGYMTAGGATGLATWNTSYRLRVYSPFEGAQLGGLVYPSIVFQDLMFMDAVNQGAFSPADLHNALMVGMGGRMLSGAAAQQLLTRVGVDPLQVAVDSTEVQVDAPTNPYGSTVLELLQNYADSEDGRLFVDRSGRVAFHNSTRFIDEPVENAVQYTFSDTDASSVGIDGDLSIVLDDSFVYEAAEVSREGGIAQLASVTNTPVRTYKLDGLKLTSDLQAQRRAEKIVFRYGSSKPRSDSWDVWPEADPTDWVTLLQLDIGHRVRLVVTPGGVGSEIDLQQHVELIEHHVTPTDWVITMNGSPVDETAYFKWGGVGATEGWGNGVWR